MVKKTTTAKDSSFSGYKTIPDVLLYAPQRGFRLRRPKDLIRLFGGNPAKLQAAEEALSQVNFRDNDDIEAPIGTKREKVRKMLTTFREPSRGYFAILFKLTPPEMTDVSIAPARVRATIGGIPARRLRKKGK